MFSIKYLFWRWCGAPGFFTPVVSCAPRATKKTLRVEALAPFFLTCWSREIQCDGLCHYGPQKIWPSKSMGLKNYGRQKKNGPLVSEPCCCDPEWCLHCFDQARVNFLFTTLLFLREWFLGACNMDFVILLPLRLQLPFTLYPSLQLHPSLRPSPYTHQLYYLWSLCFVSVQLQDA